MGIQCAHEQPITEDRDAPVVPSAAEVEVVLVRQLVVVSPVRPAGLGVEGDDVARRLGHVHHAVHDQRRRFGAVERPELIGPLQLESRRAIPVNLVEPAVALAVVVARVHQPVLRFFRRAQQTLGGDRAERGCWGARLTRLRPCLRLARECRNGRQQRGEQHESFHGRQGRHVHCSASGSVGSVYRE